MNQNGGTKLPDNNSGWALETSLDVEWAHAMAPAANLLLVEASSSSHDGAPAIWPAVSPNVLSVGGTTLSLTDSSGTYGSETAWSDSGAHGGAANSLPNAQASLYNVAASSYSTDFHDVTAGSNGSSSLDKAGASATTW